ncbi:MAG: sulfatase-like hydrolase/transferase [Ectothiorhodospiraceae bacterium]|nr:sulfatase-like hydrolase/transferase [Ectothiorhodospiraceae bacterium]
MMRPQNLLFVFSDEHTREITGCYGNSVIKTPNMDRLAARGTVFDNAYTNCPICVPARASLATGRYVHDIRLWDNGMPYHGVPTGWGHRLIAAGHQVTAMGKLHYRSATDPTGWSEEIGTLHVVDGEGDIAGAIRSGMVERSAVKQLSREAGRGDSTYIRYDTRTTAGAVRWLREEAPRHTDRPWVLFVGLVLPHFPLVAPPFFYDLYPELPPPRLYGAEDRPNHPVIKELRRVQAYDRYFDAESLRRARTAYHGMVSYLDFCLGQIVEALESSPAGRDTRILYTTDHGDNIGHRGMWGKSNMYEESASIPMILSGADVPVGHRVAEPVSLVDVYQTVIEGVGLSLEEEERETLPGHSLVRIANGDCPERTVLSEYHAVGAITGFFMIRHERWKYVHYVGAPPQLFDLAEDPHETTDRAADPRCTDVLRVCEARLRAVVDPEAANAQAFADQAAQIERHGGRDALMARGSFGYTPAPGEPPRYD